MKTRRNEMEEHLWPNEGKDKNGLSFPYVTCAITGKKHSVMEAQAHPLSMNLDHEIPVARGGRNELKNCQPLGTAINQIKGDRTNEELFDILFDISLPGSLVTKLYHDGALRPHAQVPL